MIDPGVPGPRKGRQAVVGTGAEAMVLPGGLAKRKLEGAPPAALHGGSILAAKVAQFFRG